MTSNPSNPSTSTAAMPQPAPSVAKVLAALHRLGEATAAAIATEAGLGYSTTTPKLRSLETAGLAESTRSDTGPSLWRLTDTGRAQEEQGDDHSQPGSQPSPGDAAIPDAAASQGSRDDDAQENREVTGQDHDQRPTAADPTDGRPDATQEPASSAPSDVEVASDEAAEPDNTGDGDDRSTAEPDLPATTDDTDPAAGAPTADQSAAEPATTDEPAAGTAACDTTDDPVAGGSPAAPPAAEAVGEAPEAGSRRASGTLRGAILDILEANPGKGYKVSELCKLVDRANEGTGAKKASAGAVHNAAVKLVGTGQAVLAVEKPATFALADPAI
jgi:DNA-binding MarR family transcriptional regulator